MNASLKHTAVICILWSNDALCMQIIYTVFFMPNYKSLLWYSLPLFKWVIAAIIGGFHLTSEWRPLNSPHNAWNLLQNTLKLDKCMSVTSFKGLRVCFLKWYLWMFYFCFLFINSSLLFVFVCLIFLFLPSPLKVSSGTCQAIVVNRKLFLVS